MFRCVLIGFFVLLVALFAAQSLHPNCSMTEMVGVEWIECLAK